MSETTECPDPVSDLRRRVDELLQSNNEKLFENREQRQTIRKLQAQVAFLLETIPVRGHGEES